MSNFTKIHPVAAELIHVDRHTDRQTDMMKLKGVFCDYLNTPKNQFHLLFYGCKTWHPIVMEKRVIFTPTYDKNFFSPIHHHLQSGG